ncbi:hypothetical protein BDY21DRAFT_399201 [Lineolata rhizophorae]|uniref:Uncharacterized protein n=1 Tax=Lineolata rhizophorae TaxID=578093 RepID=A0A6A6NU44_9PEZI|nr:hypothetical protein BDY21DRAFT_399201 [Lineolata rhizophorae]
MTRSASNHRELRVVIPSPPPPAAVHDHPLARDPRRRLRAPPRLVGVAPAVPAPRPLPPPVAIVPVVVVVARLRGVDVAVRLIQRAVVTAAAAGRVVALAHAAVVVPLADHAVAAAARALARQAAGRAAAAQAGLHLDVVGARRRRRRRRRRVHEDGRRLRRRHRQRRRLRRNHLVAAARGLLLDDGGARARDVLVRAARRARAPPHHAYRHAEFLLLFNFDETHGWECARRTGLLCGGRRQEEKDQGEPKVAGGRDALSADADYHRWWRWRRSRDEGVVFLTDGTAESQRTVTRDRHQGPKDALRTLGCLGCSQGRNRVRGRDGAERTVGWLVAGTGRDRQAGVSNQVAVDVVIRRAFLGLGVGICGAISGQRQMR